MKPLQLITCLAVLCGASFSAAQSDDARFLAGLRERRLYRLIDAYCESRLADSEFPEEQLADLIVAWIHAGTQRALEASPQQRDHYWQRLNNIAEASDRVRKAPRAVLIDLQLGLAAAARAEATAGETDDSTKALAEYRRSLDALERINVEVSEHLKSAYQQPASKRNWKPGELEALRRNLLVESARVYRLQALSFPDGSPDRINSLTLALERLQELVGLATEEPIVWQARVEQVRCLRLLQRFDEARATLDGWLESSPTEEAASRLAGELLRLDLATGETRRALNQAEAMLREPGEVRAPESDQAILEVLLAAQASRLVPEPGEKKRLTQLAATQANTIAQRHGPYWQHRAQATLGRALADSASTDDPQLLTHAAASLFQAGKLAEAVAAYDRAAAEYEHASSEQSQFESAYRAAAIVRETGDVASAEQRFRQLSLRLPQHPQAATAHLTAVGLAASQVREATAAAGTTAEAHYQTLLEEQLEIWSRGDEADTARWWLGRLRLSQNDWSAALKQFTSISRESTQFAEAASAAADCYERMVGRTDSDADRAKLVSAATEFLQPIVSGSENRWPNKWTDLQRNIALRLSELHLLHVPAGHDYAYKLLRAALKNSPDADATWKSPAKALAAAALARRGDVSSVIPLLWDEKTFTAESVLLFLETVQFDQQLNEELQREMAEAVVLITELISTNAEQVENKEALGKFARYRGMAHELLGHRQAALSAYNDWRRYCPESGAAQETYASLVGKSRNPKYLLESLHNWQQIEKQSKPAGPRWWRARRARIELLEQLGEGAQAEKLRQLTKVLYPDRTE